MDFRSDIMYEFDEDSFLPNTFSREPFRVARDDFSSVRVEPSSSQSPRRVRFSDKVSIEDRRKVVARGLSPSVFRQARLSEHLLSRVE